jgi:hypothetical protein
MYGKVHIPETLLKQSIVKRGDKNPMYGKYGAKNPSSKPVMQLDCESRKTISIFPSILSASSATGIPFWGISKCCCGKQITTRDAMGNKYCWEFESMEGL